MPKSFQVCLKALAASFGWGRDATEESLNRLEVEFDRCTSGERNELRRQLVLVVAQLSRLEMRMWEKYGPNDSTV